MVDNVEPMASFPPVGVSLPTSHPVAASSSSIPTSNAFDVLEHVTVDVTHDHTHGSPPSSEEPGNLAMVVYDAPDIASDIAPDIASGSVVAPSSEKA